MKGVHADVVPPWLQPAARRILTTYRSRGLERTDLLLAAFPKAGSTWLRFVLASALADQEMDYDLVAGVAPPIGRQRIGPRIVPGGGRFIRTHEPPYFASPRRNHPRVLVLVRDGRDIAVSHYHHLRRQGRVTASFDEFFPQFLAGRVGSYGSWQRHSAAWLRYAGADTSVRILRYEDLLADPEKELAAVDAAFGLDLSADKISDALVRNSPKEMREKEATAARLQRTTKTAGIPFVREARAGNWREALSPQQCAEFERVAGDELRQLGYPLVGS